MRYLTVRLSTFAVGLLGGLLLSLLLLHMVFAANGRVATVAYTAANTRIAGPPPLTLRLSSSQPQYNMYLPIMLRNS